jgi:hypothetical protein
MTLRLLTVCLQRLLLGVRTAKRRMGALADEVKEIFQEIINELYIPNQVQVEPLAPPAGGA